MPIVQFKFSWLSTRTEHSYNHYSCQYNADSPASPTPDQHPLIYSERDTMANYPKQNSAYRQLIIKIPNLLDHLVGDIPTLSPLLTVFPCLTMGQICMMECVTFELGEEALVFNHLFTQFVINVTFPHKVIHLNYSFLC
jgi:hypothetical protein